MTLDDFKKNLQWLAQDPTVESAFDRLIADERLSFASEYDLPALKRHQPFSGSVNTSNWLYDLPSTYQKKVFRARNSDPSEFWFRTIHTSIAAIERLDFDHNETGTYVQQLAIEDRQMAIFPKAFDVIYLWFFEKPDVAGDIVELPEEWISRVLEPRVVLRTFRLYPDLAREAATENRLSLEYWRRLQFESLYGSAQTGSLGFLNAIIKNRPPRIRGGRQSLP